MNEKYTVTKPKLKILAINGSHHGDRGYTRFLIDLIFAGAKEAGGECEAITLAKLKLNRCLGCDTCQKEVSIPVDQQSFSPHCVWNGKDDGQTIFEKMAAADLIIYATPIHVFSMTALMKNFFDRFYAIGKSDDLQLSDAGLMFHFIDHRIVSKPFVALICCSNLEAETSKNAITYFHSFSRFMDAPLVGMLVRNGSALVGKGRDTHAEERFPRIRDVYAAYREAGRDLVHFSHIRRNTRRRANQEIVPVPMFDLLKRIPLRNVKLKFIERAQDFAERQGL
ncbi:MAG: flavodoxin family protein [Anaerolineaceae bacterium]|jgi:multimeric flavodoxin WrbA